MGMGHRYVALTVGSRALGAFEPRQVRKEAALSTPSQVPRHRPTRAGGGDTTRRSPCSTTERVTGRSRQGDMSLERTCVSGRPCRRRAPSERPSPAVRCLSLWEGTMVPSSSGGPSRPMNDWMTSVADIPDDADDDLSGISPELVLVDPELARLVRERQPVPATPALTRASSLRLVRAIEPTEETEAPIVPRPSPRTDVEASPPVRDEPSTPIPATPQRDEAADATPASVAPPAPAIEAEPEPALDPSRRRASSRARAGACLRAVALPVAGRRGARPS